MRLALVLLLAWGDLRARRGRYVLIVLAITVSVMLVVALNSILSGSREFLEQTLKRVYPSDIMIMSSSIDIPERFAAELRRSSLVESAEGIIIVGGLVGGRQVTIVGVPLRDIDYFSVDLVIGRLPSGPGEAVVELGLADVGDRISIIVVDPISGSRRMLEAEVVGVMRSLLRGFIGAFRLNLIVVPLSWLQERLGTGPFVNSVLITLRDKSLVPAVADVLKRELETAQVYTQESLIRTVSRAFSVIGAAFSAISLVALSAALITSLAVFAITARERAREIAYLRMLGIPQSAILASLLLEASVIGLAGGAAGVAAGLATALNADEVLSLAGYRVDIPAKPDAASIVLGLASSMAISLAGTSVVVVRLFRTRPVEILARWV